MKEIMAIIRMNKINETKRALGEEGFPSITCRRAYGRGKRSVDFHMIEEIIEGNESEIGSPTVMESISEGHRLIAKRLLYMVVQDEDVKKVVDTIIEVNQTGNMGDGKIFVMPIEDAIRVRTGETGEIAI